MRHTGTQYLDPIGDTHSSTAVSSAQEMQITSVAVPQANWGRTAEPGLSLTEQVLAVSPRPWYTCADFRRQQTSDGSTSVLSILSQWEGSGMRQRETGS
jgi:hypothetical protein